MSALSPDELNEIQSAKELAEQYIADSNYERYFGEMDLSNREKQKRISFAEKFEDSMLFIFALYLVIKKYNRMNEKYLISQAQSKYSEIISERDKRVRVTHREVDGMELPIERAFLVGDSLMNFPKDTSMGASSKEIIACRCTVKYLK